MTTAGTIEGVPRPVAVAPVAARQKVSYPVLLGNEATWTAYRVKSLPRLFLVDRQGRVVRRFGGGVSHRTLEKEVRDQVRP